MPNQSDRRKLKPKRYDKFEDSQGTPSINVNADVAYVPQRVSKRSNTDLPDLPNKKRCYGLMHPPSSTVNLANNRLNKLKKSLQAGLNNPNVSTTESSAQTSSTNVPIRDDLNVQIKDDLNVPVSTSSSSKNIYHNLSKWASAPDASSSQNSANNRMSRLKKVINESKFSGSPKFSDSSGVSNNSRPLTEISYRSQYSSNSPKSQLFKNKYQFDTHISNNHSSNKPVKLLNQNCSNTNDNFEMRDSNPKMGNIDQSSNNLSSRSLKIRKNTEQLTSLVNSNEFSTSENINLPKNTTSMSERLKLVRNFNPLVTNSNVINSRSSLDIQTDSQGIQNSSTQISSPVKLNRNFTPLINDNFNTLNNNSTINKPSNDKSDISNASPLSQTLSLQNRNFNVSSSLLKTQKEISPISQRLKLNRQSFTSLSPTDNTKNIRPCKLNNNLAPKITANDTSDIIKTTPLSETIILKNNITLSNKPFNSSTHLFDTQKQKSPISERLKLKRKSSTPLSISSIEKNVKPFTFKEPPTPILTQESLKTLNNPTPVIEDQATNDEYEVKMKMTASWIINHQQFSNSFSNSPEVLEAGNNRDSLNVSSGKSDAATHGNMDDSEEMEWTNAEPDNSTREIDEKQENRAEILKLPLEEEQLVAKIPKVEKEKRLCIIVDTNIFISELSKLTDIITLKISGAVQPLIYIPWMVVTELDELKDRSGDRNLKKSAFDAIKFINKALSEENPRIKGQSINDMGTQNHIGSSPDDKIMATCLQAVERYESVILLSNDLNLKNKAMINNISASSANEIIMKIISKVTKTTKTQKIKQKMGILCSEIICGCAKDAYGDMVWSKMDMLSNPPWPFLECLKRFKKYWTAVFQERLLKHFLSAVDKLHKLMTDNKDICDDSPTYVEFVKLSLSVCIFLKDIEDYRGSVENVLNDLTKIG